MKTIRGLVSASPREMGRGRGRLVLQHPILGPVPTSSSISASDLMVRSAKAEKTCWAEAEGSLGRGP